MSEETARPPEEMAFGEAMTELEEIVAALEGGQLELEESMKRYERGVALMRGLRAKLSDAQQKITTLIGELDVDEESSSE